MLTGVVLNDCPGLTWANRDGQGGNPTPTLSFLPGGVIGHAQVDLASIADQPILISPCASYTLWGVAIVGLENPSTVNAIGQIYTQTAKNGVALLADNGYGGTGFAGAVSVGHIFYLPLASGLSAAPWDIGASGVLGAQTLYYRCVKNASSGVYADIYIFGCILS